MYRHRLAIRRWHCVKSVPETLPVVSRIEKIKECARTTGYGRSAPPVAAPEHDKCCAGGGWRGRFQPIVPETRSCS
jgi:hypothetical protein